MNNFTKKIFFFAAVVSVGYALFSCGGEDEKKFDVFNVDSTRIASEVADTILGVKFNPPKLWNNSASEIGEKRSMNLDFSKRTMRSFVYRATNLFYNAGRGSVLNIGYVTLRDRNENGEASLDDYVTQSTEKWKNAKVRKSTFSKNELEFTRLDIDYGAWHTVRVIFYNASGELIQFEYSTQSENRETELPWIEASIGTIRLM